MATADFTIKQHDLLPEIAGVCADANNVIPNITGSTVRFIMTDKATGIKVLDQPGEIVDGPGGVVKYSWSEGDTDVAGTYIGEFEILFPSMKPETFPNNKNKTIKIFPDLGGVD